MIRLTCTQCKTTLEMDDAFAGGVCRCQHCGTIQTVPSHLKGTATTAASAGSAKSLYQGSNGAGAAGAQGNGTGSGLDDLADVVASSGLSRSGLRRDPSGGRGKGTSGAGKARAAPPAPNRVPLLAAAGGVILVLIGVIVWLATRGGSAPEGGPNPSGLPGATSLPGGPGPAVRRNDTGGPAGGPTPGDTGGTPPAVALPTPSGPHFLSVPVSATKVVYLVDRGGSAKAYFDGVKAAVFSSLDSLGPNREFAVIFWSRPGDGDWKEWSFPEKGLAHANPDVVQACKDKFADTEAVGTTEVVPAVGRAAALKPDAIFLITAKGYNLDAGSVGSVRQALGGSHAKVYSIDLTSQGEGKDFLEPIATQSGGSYTVVPPGQLR